MNYDNIVYPLDKIYSQATGVGCTVTPASVSDTVEHNQETTLDQEQ